MRIIVYILFLILSGNYCEIYSLPLLGHITERTAIVVETDEYDKIDIKCINCKGEELNKYDYQIKDNKVFISGLIPGYDYSFEYYNIKKYPPNYEQISLDTVRFTSDKIWQWREDPPELTISIGSCSFINDSVYDRPGKGYGRSTSIFQAIADKSPDIHIWLGDNWYYREADWTSEFGMEYRISHNRSDENIKAMFSIPNYAIWDDHDFGPNDSDRSFNIKNIAKNVFLSSWGNPESAGEEGIYTYFEKAGVEFILLDDRTFRAPNRYPDDMERKDYFGEEQLQWLKDRLISSRAKYKVLANGGQVLNTLAEYETYARFAKEREELLSFIQENDIKGVIFLSGDRHYAELSKHPDHPILDFTSSPISSGAFAGGCDSKNLWRVDGTCVNENNFGTLTFSGTYRDRICTLRTYDSEGKLVWEKVWDGEEMK
ncbi:MAG: alkaline phosphatase D family protein [Candidatus Kapaibacteriales bacterium]